MRRFIESVLICFFIGLGFAGLFGYWNTQGILIDEYIAGSVSITDLQTIVIFLWMVVGAIIGLFRSR